MQRMAQRSSLNKINWKHKASVPSFLVYRILLPRIVRARETQASQANVLSSVRMHACTHARVQYNTGPLACLLCLLTAPEIGFDGLPDKLFLISFQSTTSIWYAATITVHLSGSDSGAQCGLGFLAPEGGRPRGQLCSHPTPPGVGCARVLPVVALFVRFCFPTR